VFFDPDAKEPVPWPLEKMEAELFEAMRKAGTPPQIIYAYKKTGGLLLTEESHRRVPGRCGSVEMALRADKKGPGARVRGTKGKR
jgi:hypothetical protein